MNNESIIEKRMRVCDTIRNTAEMVRLAAGGALGGILVIDVTSRLFEFHITETHLTASMLAGACLMFLLGIKVGIMKQPASTFSTKNIHRI